MKPELCNFSIEVSSWEAGPNLWVATPTIVETLTGRKVFAFADERWSLNRSSWRSQTVVECWLRKFPGTHSPSEVSVMVDCAAETAEVDGQVVALAAFETALDAELVWPRADAPAASKGVLDRIRKFFGAANR